MITREQLEKEYIINNKTRKQVAFEFGVNVRMIKSLVKRYKFPNKRTGPKVGTKFTDGHKTKIGLANKGKPRSEEYREKISKSLTGRKFTLEQRMYHCKYARKGISHPRWKGETPEYLRIRANFNYKLWRQSVFLRDNFKCVKCGDSTGGNLNAHHIKRFSVLIEESKEYMPLLSVYDAAIQYTPLWDISNGITVCERCHKELHKR